MPSTVEELKRDGNENFRRKEYEAAVQCYTKAIELDSRNAVLHNNRAGAFLELSKLSLAIRDAETAASIEPFGECAAKAHSRLGRAHWMMGKHSMALSNYRKAVSLAPDNADYRKSVTALEVFVDGSSSATGGGRAKGDSVVLCEAAANTVIILATATCVFFMLFSAYISALAWKIALVAMATRQVFALLQLSPVLPRPSLTFAKAFFSTVKCNVSNFCVQFLWFPLVLLAMNSPPIHLFLVSFTLYALVDAACPIHPSLRAGIYRLPLPNAIVTRLQQMERQPQHKQSLLLNAGLCEVCAGLMTPLAGAGIMTTIVTMQWLKTRYRSDATVKAAYAHLRLQLGRWAHHQRAPSIIGKAFDTICRFMHSFATA